MQQVLNTSSVKSKIEMPCCVAVFLNKAAEVLMRPATDCHIFVLRDLMT